MTVINQKTKISKAEGRTVEKDIKIIIQKMLTDASQFQSNIDDTNRILNIELRRDPKTNDIVPKPALAQAVVDSKTAEIISAQSSVRFLPVGDTTQEQKEFYMNILNHVQKEDGTHIKTAQVAHSGTSLGLGILFIGASLNKRIVVSEDTDKDGNSVEVANEVQSLQIGTRSVPASQFFFNTKDFDTATVCMEIQKITSMEFEKNFDASNTDGDSFKQVNTEEHNTVYLVHYWDIVNDVYQIRAMSAGDRQGEQDAPHKGLSKENMRDIAEGSVAIRTSINIFIDTDGRKRLPYSVFQNGFEAIGEPLKMRSIIHEANITREVIQRANKLQGTTVVEHRGFGDIGEQQRRQLGKNIQTWNVEPDAALSIHSFPGASPALLQYKDSLESVDIAKITGINVDQVIAEPSTSPLQAAIREDVKSMRLAVPLLMWDHFMHRVEFLMYNRIVQYIQILKDAKGAKNAGDMDKFTVLVKDLKLTSSRAGSFKLKRDIGKLNRIEVTPDLVPDIDIQIETRSGSTLAALLERQGLIESLNTMSGVLAQLGENGSPERFEELTGVRLPDVMKAMLNKDLAILALTNKEKEEKINQQAFQEINEQTIDAPISVEQPPALEAGI